MIDDPCTPYLNHMYWSNRDRKPCTMKLRLCIMLPLSLYLFLLFVNYLFVFDLTWWLIDSLLSSLILLFFLCGRTIPVVAFRIQPLLFAAVISS